MKIYVAGAWVEQHTRARPMIARLRAAGVVITCDWTQAEGDVCACGHHRQEHQPWSTEDTAGTPFEGHTSCGGGCNDGKPCICIAFNGIGAGGDSQLTAEHRRKYALADLDGVLAADTVWLLAANDRGACGSWVELGAALAARSLRSSSGKLGPAIVVSGPKWQRTIFTELADAMFESDEEAFVHVVARAHVAPAAPVLAENDSP